ncbi:MAG: tetraacyldisaccharide 4'-kinase [Kangiella sp.]|jgi:tetraacyldisaccharide 4'-kinase|nr:tetraacyldisaccharide 4'-kinase [Kangiella sp.]
MAISKSQQFFESLWYRKTVWWLWVFWPFQLLLRLIVWLRRSFYRVGIFKSTKLKTPVIVIGNISVGGTGKTPLAIYLLELLKSQGYKPGLISRGYGGHSEQYPLTLTQSTPASESGDEPFLIYRRTQTPVVVDPIRARGAKELEAMGCDIIICDDGLQHYALQRDIEIVVVDGNRQLGNGWLMPFGPLREPKSRLKKADYIIINGQDMVLEPDSIQAINHHQDDMKEPITAVAAIGNPERFYKTLDGLGFQFKRQSFPDHYQFSKQDFESLPGSILMTEKDAVKCLSFADERFYFLPVSAKLSKSFLQSLMEQIKAITHES